MKINILLGLILLISPLLHSQQNLIPNGGFDLNPENYNGGSNPVNYYTQGSNCIQGREKFEDDITDWFVAESNAPASELQNMFVRRCSPDWIAPWAVDVGSECNTQHSSFFVASSFNAESIMVKMAQSGSEYFLVKGRTYKFQAKVRTGIGNGSFQVVFSTNDKGLNVSQNNRWVALDIYMDLSGCEWRNLEYYFTVPDNNDKNYDEMKYLVLQYNHDRNNNDFVMHYDDVVLIEEQKCIDHKYIQNWQYYDLHKIEQANVKISAGAHVAPSSSYQSVGPVTVRNNAMVIYRAPDIYLEPGFFVEEPGSYFETQVGTCVDDPCPTLPSYTPPPAISFCSPLVLGTELPTVPGIFYAWTPSEYFTAPWSRVTNFIQPSYTNTCVDTKLTVWSICGTSQEYSFPVRFFDAAPQVSVSNIVTSQSKISFKANFQNVQTYTIVVTNISSGQIIYEDEVTTECGVNMLSRTFILGACNFEMCGDKEIKVIAHNDCYGEVAASFIAPSPVSVAPSLDISNVHKNDYELSFDVGVNANTELVTVELWNENMTSVLCSKTYRSCDIAPGQTTVHWDNTMCLSGCVSVCGNQKVKIKYKNICSGQTLEEIIDWTKTTSVITPGPFPNVVTANGDGVNEELCFEVTGADHYDFFVLNRWGGTMEEVTGECITTNPVCVWAPPLNISDGVYFYRIVFYNSCGSTQVVHEDFAHVWGEGNHKIGAVADTTDDLTDFAILDRPASFEGIQVFPNPVDDYLYIRSTDKIQQATIMDLNGKMVIGSSVGNKINCSGLAAGTYFVEVKTVNGKERFKFVKL